MRVALIIARHHDVTNIYPPLGILYITASLEKHGHKVICFDINPMYEDIRDKLVSYRPDLIGFSMQTPQYKMTEELFFTLKSEPKLRNKSYCLGGIHPTALPEETLRNFGNGQLDFIVIGEGELTMAEVANNSGSYREIKGIAYIDNSNNFIQTLQRPLIPDLDSLPFPERKALNFSKYLLPPGMIRGYCLERITTLISARGCPYNCWFCTGHKIFHRKVRQRSVHNVIKEIESLIDSYNIQGFFDLNDIFTLNKEWVLEFCQAMRRGKYNLKWGCGTRVDLISEELVKEMKSAGCMQFEFGVESGSAKVLKALNKKTDPKTAEDAFDICRKQRVRTAASFMLGCPEESRDDLMCTYRLAKKIRANYTVFFFLTPFPGTKLYDDAIKNGWLRKDNVFSEKWQIRQNDYPLMKINLPPEEVKRFRNKFQNRFLIRNYFNKANFKLGLLVGSRFILHPIHGLKIIFLFLKNKRFDTIIEAGFNLYKLDLESRII